MIWQAVRGLDRNTIIAIATIAAALGVPLFFYQLGVEKRLLALEHDLAAARVELKETKQAVAQLTVEVQVLNRSK